METPQPADPQKRALQAPHLQHIDGNTTQVHLTKLQREILQVGESYRFLVAILGRRSGKTTVAVERLINQCWHNPRPLEWPLAYIAPTYKQAKRIAWGKFKQHFAPGEAHFKESELTITHRPTGSRIYLLGCDTNADTLRGIGLWDAVVDELKDISKGFLQEVLRPCFSDTGGGCLFIGTPPRSKSMAYEFYQRGQSGDKAYADWYSWNVSSLEAGLLSAEEIQAAKQELDPEVFDREYGAQFSFTQGLVVKHWSAENIQPVARQLQARIHVSCDFNVDPCMWILANRIDGRYHFFDEIVRENTTVIEMCDELARRYPPSEVNHGITINGDASGQNRHVNTERKNQTSYTLMRNRLTELGYDDVRIVVPSKNPPIMERIEAFNAKVMNANGQVSLTVHPQCRWMIHNMENLHWIEGSSTIWEPTSREIDRDRMLKFTKHIFDAASYLVAYYDPIRPVKEVGSESSEQLSWAPNLEFGI